MRDIVEYKIRVLPFVLVCEMWFRVFVLEVTCVIDLIAGIECPLCVRWNHLECVITISRRRLACISLHMLARHRLLMPFGDL